MTQDSTSTLKTPAGDVIWRQCLVVIIENQSGHFVGVGGKIVPHGTNQWTVYGVRWGRSGTHPVSTQSVAQLFTLFLSDMP